jgi:hypothetical protein
MGKYRKNAFTKLLVRIAWSLKYKAMQYAPATAFNIFAKQLKLHVVTLFNVFDKLKYLR